MNVMLVPDLGISSEVWLLLSGLTVMTLFFKFNRVWSVRNLDLGLLFVLAPGIMWLMPNRTAQPWLAYAWLFGGSLLLMFRCLCDLGLSRRPLLEPNLNLAGMGFLTTVMMALLIAETVNLPLHQGTQRNPAETAERRSQAAGTTAPEAPTLTPIWDQAPFPQGWKRPWHEVSSRVLAGLSHLALVIGLSLVGAFHFRRTATGLAIATCYLIMPYTRIAVVDSGQLFAAALLVWALVLHDRPALSGICVAGAGAWLPACLGVLPLWISFQPRQDRFRFVLAALSVLALGSILGFQWQEPASFARALGARSLKSAGLVDWIGNESADPALQNPDASKPPNLFGNEDLPENVTSFWSGIDPSYRLPVLIAYLALVMITCVWPMQKNFGELIALNATLLIASQFWYLDHGGTLVILYLPIVLLMIFRPTLKSRLNRLTYMEHDPPLVITLPHWRRHREESNS